MPEGLTHEEIGILLIGIGKAMIEHGVCAGAALDGGSNGILFKEMDVRDVPFDRAKQLIEYAANTELEGGSAWGLRKLLDFNEEGR